MTTANLPTSLTQKLGHVRRRIAAWFWIDGLSRLMLTLAALFFVSLGVDRYFRMDRPQRVIMLAIMLGLVGWVIYRRLIRPLRQPLDDDALAIQVERRHRELGDGLISALQLSRVTDPSRMGASPVLIAEAISQGVGRAQPINFDDVVDTRTRNRTMAWGIGAAVVLAAMAVAAPSVMGTWADRNLLLGAAQWPQETHLTVLGLNADGELVVPEGDDMVLRVRAQGIVPDLTYVDHRPEDGRWATEQMALVGDDEFNITFRNVLTPFRFRVRGNDAATEYIRVTTVERPTLIPGGSGLSVVVAPPEYIGKAPHEIRTDSGAYEVPQGSRIELAIEATKPLVKASIERGRDWSGPMTITHAPRRQITVGADGEDTTRVYEAGPRRATVTLDADQVQSGAYGIRMEDTDGLAGRRPIRFLLKVRPDRPPRVRAVLRGIGDLITERAVIPIAIRAHDDYAMTKLELTHQVTGTFEESAATGDPQRLAIEGPDAPDLPAEQIDEFVHRFDVEPLGLVPDVMISFTVEATDNDRVTHEDGSPKVGASTAFALKVVSEDELRAELLRRESEQRVEFERLISDQQDLLVEARALLAGLDDAQDKLTAEQWRTVSDIEKKQRLAAGRCEGIAAQYEQILQEVINNRLEEDGGTLQTRLAERIIQPLQSLAQRAVPPVADHFDTARKTTVSAAQRRAALEAGVAGQDQLLDQMRQILRSMIKSEGYQEMVNLLREILRSQQDIEERTVKELEKRIEDMFRD